VRMTPQRAVILEELRKTGNHPRADEVHALVKRRLPRVSLATVYRNLELLTRAGMIQTIELGGCPRRYDGWVEEHVHVRCLECGRLDDIGSALPSRMRKRAAELSGYEINGHNLEFTGLCPDCVTKRKGKRRREHGRS
jgi:Fur family ferric uptake transcriptional regulator